MAARRIVAIAAAIAMAGCARQNPTAHNTLVMAVATEPRSLNPLLLEGPTASWVGSLMFSFLLTDGPSGDQVPDVATAVPTLANGGISPDGVRVVYHLRKDVRWEDGAPLTARDCVFTYRAVMNPNNDIPSHYGYEDIRAVRALGPYTLEVLLRHPSRDVVTNFLALDGNYPIMPEHLLARYSSLNAIDYDERPIASGPYRVVEWTRGDHIALEANASYYRGAPHIAHLVLDFIPNSTTMLDELRTGEIGAALSIDPALLPEARTLPNVRVVLTPLLGMGELALNAAQGPTADVRVRQAIASAIDAPLVAEKASRGAFLPVDARRVLLRLPANGQTQSPAYDPARARALLDAAGWRAGPDGMRARDGKPLTLFFATSTYAPMSDTISAMVQAQLRSVGIAVTIRTFAPAVYMVPAAAGGPIFGGRFSLAYLYLIGEGNGDLQFLYDCAEQPPNGFDVSRLCDPRVDAVLAAGSSALSPQAATRDNERLVSLLEQDVPEVVLYQPRVVSVFTTQLGGFAPSAVTPYANPWRWYLRK